jgi:ubiquinone/menaquinone biosynthesis C-methylase UbiE
MGISGTLDKKYHLGRSTKKSLVYRLNRRTQEVTQSIKRYFPGMPSRIVDAGAADGLMLSKIKKIFPSSLCIGIELSWELVETNTDGDITLFQGDVNYLPLTNNAADIIVATAVIEHLQNPQKFLEETMRILKSHGLLILTSPDPFWEKIATMIGHLSYEQHYNVMNLRELAALFQKTGYTILEQKKFMLSPVGMPLELPIENILKTIGLNFLFANQLIVGEKTI